MIRRVLVAMLLATVLPTVAYAEDVVAYQAEGDAPTSSADARVMALDEAFASAINGALADLVAGDIRTARKGELDKEIVGHARLWVVKFSVTKDETVEDRRELTVSVRVDRDKIRTRLGELGITTKDAAATSGEPAREDVTILLRIAAPSGVRAAYGPSADKDAPGVGALTTILRNNGFAVRRAPSSGAAPRADGELPLSDDEADALGGRGQGRHRRDRRHLDRCAGARARTADDRIARHREPPRRRPQGLKALGQGTAITAARGDDTAYAIDRAVCGAISDVLPRRRPSSPRPAHSRATTPRSPSPASSSCAFPRRPPTRWSSPSRSTSPAPRACARRPFAASRRTAG